METLSELELCRARIKRYSRDWEESLRRGNAKAMAHYGRRLMVLEEWEQELMAGDKTKETPAIA